MSDEAERKRHLAWWRGVKVRDAGHDLKWYKRAIEAYTEDERSAFLGGYNRQPWSDYITPP